MDSLCIGLLLLTVAYPTTHINTISLYEGKRHLFYAQETKLLTHDALLPPPLHDMGANIRIGYFDANWHGLTIQEYVRIAAHLGSDVLIARGIPDQESYRQVAGGRLVGAGFDKSSFIVHPLTVLPSGIIIGAKHGIVIVRSSPISYHNSTVGYMVRLKVPLYPAPVAGRDKKYGRLRLIILTIDAFNRMNRKSQLKRIKSVIDGLNVHRPAVVLGGFYSSEVDWGDEALLLSEFSGSLQNVFNALGRPSPSYTSWHGASPTSWHGGFTDTILVTPSLTDAIVDAGIWHTDTADSLPVFVDLSRQQLVLRSPYNHLRASAILLNYQLVAAVLGLLLIVAALLMIFRRVRNYHKHPPVEASVVIPDPHSDVNFRRPSVCSHECCAWLSASAEDP